MAGQTSNDGQFNPYLSTTQQDLLLAALASNGYNNNNNNAANGNATIKRSDSDTGREQQFVAPSYVDGAMFDSTQKDSQQTAAFGNFDFDDTSPYLEYLDGDTTLNFDSNDLGGEDMFGDIPGPQTDSSESDKGDKSDKRKSPDDGDDEELDGDAKRREGDDKTSKKPGRKPLTSEPTTVSLPHLAHYHYNSSIISSHSSIIECISTTLAPDLYPLVPLSYHRPS